ncbi:MAG TPA: phage baseplate assembly protein V [Planctomycetota bacterium]
MKPIEGLPRPRVTIGGVPLALPDEVRLLELRVRRRLSLPAQAEIVFAELPDRAVKPGAPIEIAAADRVLFTGDVTAVEHEFEPTGGHVVRVRAYDVLHRLRKRRPLRVHVQVRAADLARELVGDLGLTVEAGEDGPLHDRRTQCGPTDLDLLRAVTEECGLYFDLRGDTLCLFPLSGTGAPVLLERGTTLLQARVELNAEPACRSVAAVGWDPGRAEVHRATAREPRTARALSELTAPAAVGEEGGRTRAGRVMEDAARAEAVAQAALDVEVARETTLWAVAAGDPALRPGTPVEIAGLAADLDGLFVPTVVEHVIDARLGYVTEFSTSPPVPDAAAPSTAVAVGVITGVDDPEKLGRVRALLPGMGDLETGWMAVVIPGAGPKKGCVALPDVDDRVLVLLPDGDAARALVLGGLYGAGGAPDAGVEGGAVKRYTFGTPDGQTIRLDDAKGTVRVENKGGSYVELAPDGVTLHAAADLRIEAPGKSVVIRGRTVDFQQA